jgi:hypothetical protein
MKKLLKIFNPLIWFINVFILYFGHLETYKRSRESVPYDFSQDIKYF